MRKSGTQHFVELHVEVDGQATVQVQEGHDIGGTVRNLLRNSPLRIAEARGCAYKTPIYCMLSVMAVEESAASVCRPSPRRASTNP
ncbi:MAG: cation transporter dimerization domain-containing protein [Pirellulales bacterium]